MESDGVERLRLACERRARADAELLATVPAELGVADRWRALLRWKFGDEVSDAAVEHVARHHERECDDRCAHLPGEQHS